MTPERKILAAMLIEESAEAIRVAETVAGKWLNTHRGRRAEIEYELCRTLAAELRDEAQRAA